jgi:hypothetical protein
MHRQHAWCAKPEGSQHNTQKKNKKKDLHVHAADGFLKTGFLCSLDDAAGDEQIVREAGAFWKELNMRAKITAAVAAVRTEVEAGRLHWTQMDVQRLIKPYPRRGKVDAILERIGDDAGNELANESDDDSSAADDFKEGDDKHIDSDLNLSADESNAAEGGAGEDTQSVGEGDDEQPSAVAEDSKLSAVTDDVFVSPEEAECVLQSRKTIAALQSAKQTCEEVGSMAAVVHIENEIRKEERTLRQRTSENPDLLRALARNMDMEAAETATRKRLVDEANAQTLSAKKLRKQIQDANAKLRSTKQSIVDAEAVLEAKHAVRSFAIEDLGGGGRGNAKKQRLELLDRLSRIGQGLSAPQRNDFVWFKNAWDARMSEEHGDGWPHVLAGWVQNILNDFEVGTGNAFSVFVRAETIRNFSETLALQVPGAS